MKSGNENLTQENMQAAFTSLLQTTNLKDIRGIQITHEIRVLNKLFDMAVSRLAEHGELSVPRLGILMRLFMEEKKGNTAGINPTLLSHYQGVGKNTISALLDGLEESGLIERTPHPSDRRASLVRITQAGRDLVYSSAPQRFEFLDRMTSGLTEQDREELLRLLGKLRKSVLSILKTESKNSTPVEEK